MTIGYHEQYLNSDAFTVTAEERITPLSLKIYTPPIFNTHVLMPMQTAATIAPRYPKGAIPSRIPDYFMLRADTLGYGPEEVAEMIEGYYENIAAMGALILVKHGPGICPEVKKMLQRPRLELANH